MNNSKKYIIGAIIIFCLLLLTYGGIQHHNGYQQFTNNNEQQVSTLQQKYHKSDQLEYTFYYKADCAGCEKMKPTIVPLLRNAKKQHKHLIVINVRNKSMIPEATQNYVSQVPTIRVMYHNKLIYQYTGHNKKQFRKVFHGIDPQTGHKIKKRINSDGVIKNDFTKTLAQQPNK